MAGVIRRSRYIRTLKTMVPPTGEACSGRLVCSNAFLQNCIGDELGMLGAPILSPARNLGCKTAPCGEPTGFGEPRFWSRYQAKRRVRILPRLRMLHLASAGPKSGQEEVEGTPFFFHPT